MAEPLVSIFCMAYNHAPYIRKALDGFLMQKTNFPFEIIVHDDASTDATPSIIQEYENKYPEIVKAIYQTQNQYYKVDIFREFVLPVIRGKYTAFCEGDDYWTHDEKLQTQISYMEKHSECSMTFHAADYIVDGICVCNDRRADRECDFSPEQIIDRGGMFCATASLCCRSEFVGLYPEFREKAVVGDYALQVLMSLKGKVHYFPKCMAAYTAVRPGSWSARRFASDKRTRDWTIAEIRTLCRINEYSGGKYKEVVCEKINVLYKFLWSEKLCNLSEIGDLMQEVEKRIAYGNFEVESNLGECVKL